MVMYEDPEDAYKGQVVSCTCTLFCRYGSACKHMYLVARDTKCLVEAAIDCRYELPDNEPNIIIEEPNVTVVSNPFTGKRAAPINE